MATPSGGSRVCVKNVPQNVTRDELHETFSEAGEVTEVWLGTKNEKRRGLAFVGFRTLEAALRAKKMFNCSFLGPLRLTVEEAKPPGDPTLPKPWSAKSQAGVDRQHNSVTTGSKEVERERQKPTEPGETNNDPAWEEFKALMQPRSQTKLWANDFMSDIVGGSAHQGGSSDANTESPHEEPKQEEGCDQEDERQAEPQQRQHFGSIMDYFQARTTSEDTASQQEQTRNSEGEALAAPSAEAREEEVEDTRRLYVRNIPYQSGEDEVKAFFEHYGPVEDVHLIVDRALGKSKGMAYVTFESEENAAEALNKCANIAFEGRLLHVARAKSKNQKEGKQNDSRKGGTSSFKREKEERDKERAKDRRTWNSLFMRQDTVAEALAERLGVRKADILSPENSELAVKMSLGEAQVITETKQSLARQGVDTELLEKAAASAGPQPEGKESVQRSTTALLLKNLPYSANAQSLTGMCERHGTLVKFALASPRTLAVAEFAEAADAKAAFKGLAFRRYGDAPLYVEFAPLGIFTGDAGHAPTSFDAAEELGAKSQAARSDRALQISNLPPQSSGAAVRSACELYAGQGSVISARLTKEGRRIGSWVAHVEFRDAKSAELAERGVHGERIHGREVEARMAESSGGEAASTTSADSSSVKMEEPKLLVRNVAFEASRKEVRELFRPFGELRAVRLPKKVGGNHRGFAFVEFASKRDATSAMNALARAHFYGRHLVVEPAKQAEGIEELRERAKRTALLAPSESSLKRQKTA